MATEKKEITLQERFEMHATTKSFGKRVFNLVKDKDFRHMSMCQLFDIKGMGRSGVILIAEVCADLEGKS